jgi:hypothetical protein
MNRILTDLRNRLTTEQLIKISIEGPSDLDNDLKDLIIDSWKIGFFFFRSLFSYCISNRRKKVVVL